MQVAVAAWGHHGAVEHVTQMRTPFGAVKEQR